jgi:hypothetical protein
MILILSLKRTRTWKTSIKKKDQNILNKFIKEEMNIDWIDNKEKKNKIRRIERNLDNDPKLSIIEGFIEAIQDDNCKCKLGKGPNTNIIEGFIEEEDIIECEHGESPNIDIIKGFIEEEHNID